MNKFILRQGSSFEESHVIREFTANLAEQIHMDMVVEMEKTMKIIKSYYMRAWYLHDNSKVRVYDYGSHTDFFYLVEEEQPDEKQTNIT